MTDELAERTGDAQWRDARFELRMASGGFSTLRDRFGAPLVSLMAVTSLLLLLTLTNLAGLQLARGRARAREMAVRAALGAGRWRIWRQLLTESVGLSLIGGLLGVGLVYVATDVLVAMLSSGRDVMGPAPMPLSLRPGASTIGFSAIVAVASGLLVGLPPAWDATAHAPGRTLGSGRTLGATRSGRRFGQTLVMAQVAVSLVLVSVGALFIGHLSALRWDELGFDRADVRLMTLAPQGSGFDRDQLQARYQELLDRARRLPGVEAATVSGTTPIHGAAGSSFIQVVNGPDEGDARRRVMLNLVAPDYFATFGTPVLAGRTFHSDEADGPPVAIINRATALHYFGTGDPLGRQLVFEGDDTPHTIVGVVADAKYLDLREAAPRTVYQHVYQQGRLGSQFAFRTRHPAPAFESELRRLTAAILPGVQVRTMTSLAAQMDASLVPERLLASLSGGIGALGLLLAAVGLYGLLALTVTRRTAELGIRMALGATSRSVLALVARHAAGLLVTGLVMGAGLAVAVSRLLDATLPGLPSATPSIGAAMLVLTLAAIVAAWVPAWRAVSVDPSIALRRE